MHVFTHKKSKTNFYWIIEGNFVICSIMITVIAEITSSHFSKNFLNSQTCWLHVMFLHLGGVFLMSLFGKNFIFKISSLITNKKYSESITSVVTPHVVPLLLSIRSKIILLPWLKDTNEYYEWSQLKATFFGEIRQDFMISCANARLSWTITNNWWRWRGRIEIKSLCQLKKIAWRKSRLDCTQLIKDS